MTRSPIRKVFQGVADRRQMFRMFDRHRERPNFIEAGSTALYTGEWFEIAGADHAYMFEIAPPLWIRGEMFALREYLAGSVTSVFYALRIDGKLRYFHAYCDLSQARSAFEMREAIIARESRPVWTMTREERIEHIWSATHDGYRGYAGELCMPEHRGKRTVLLYRGRRGTSLKLLDALTDEEISAKLPVHLRLPLAIAA